MTSQKSLFETETQPINIPLAEQARPTRIEDIVGQDKLLQRGSILHTMIEEDQYSSFILWGPPGTGKTTIARLIENTSDHIFSSFSAVLSKIGDVKKLMQQADHRHKITNTKTIVFIDEIHRFNKSQQDAFLPYVESGAVILIGATTENPSFEIISALLSRCHVLVLETLSEPSIIQILQRAISLFPGKRNVNDEAFSLLARKSGGDGRKALNNLEMVLRSTYPEEEITPDQVEKYTVKNSFFYDKNGEEHYNLISAFQKSIRGSSPQAAIYWLARMLEAGEDPMYIVRRLVRIATEDIGLADPSAITQAIAVKDATHFLGMPEANTALTQLTIYLATAPKSNTTETAYLKAQQDARKTSHYRVPPHICNAPTKLMKNLGYGKGYKYSHNFDNAYSYQRYFPDQMEEKEYYLPSQFGFEKEIQKRLDWWNKLKAKEQEDSNPNPKK